MSFLFGRSKRKLVEEQQRKEEAAFEEEQRQKQQEANRLSDPATRYVQLEAYLEAKQFADADQETYKIMVHMAGCTETISKDAMLTFPCEDLCQIDRRWTQHSQGRFGFSAQKKIWDAGPISQKIDFQKFGWRPYQPGGVMIDRDMDFESLAPGYLPYRCLIWIDCYYYGSPKMAMVGAPSQGWFMKDLDRRLSDGLTLLMQRFNDCQ
jgi:hypothetical protein